MICLTESSLSTEDLKAHPPPTVTHLLQQGYTYFNDATTPNNATLFGGHFLSSHHTLSYLALLWVLRIQTQVFRFRCQVLYPKEPFPLPQRAISSTPGKRIIIEVCVVMGKTCTNCSIAEKLQGVYILLEKARQLWKKIIAR